VLVVEVDFVLLAALLAAAGWQQTDLLLLDHLVASLSLLQSVQFLDEFCEFGLDIPEDCQLFGIEETLFVGNGGVVLLDVVEVVEDLLYLVL
jgi:hypothetical protein